MDRIAALQEILRTQPDDTFARYGLAMALAGEGRNDEAVAEYKHLNEHTPEYVPAYQMLAQLEIKRGHMDEARASARAGLAAAERSGNTHAASELRAMLDELG